MASFYGIRDSGLGRSLAAANVVFWFEALGVLAFAVAWLTKGNVAGGIANFMGGEAAKADDDRGAEGSVS